jgi:hypothetical protein
MFRKGDLVGVRPIGSDRRPTGFNVVGYDDLGGLLLERYGHEVRFAESWSKVEGWQIRQISGDGVISGCVADQVYEIDLVMITKDPVFAAFQRANFNLKFCV